MTFGVSEAPSVGGEARGEIWFQGFGGCGAEGLASGWACAEPGHRGSPAAWALGWGSGCRRTPGSFLQASGGTSVDVGTEASSACPV